VKTLSLGITYTIRHTLNNHTQEHEEITDTDDKYWVGGREGGGSNEIKNKKDQ
jgi:hypothetical protein